MGLSQGDKMADRTEDAGAVRMMGYLEKKSKLRFVPSWRRYWFILQGKLLLYYRSKADYLSISPCRGSINLGLASGVHPSRPSASGYPIQIVTRTQSVHLVNFLGHLSARPRAERSPPDEEKRMSSVSEPDPISLHEVNHVTPPCLYKGFSPLAQIRFHTSRLRRARERCVQEQWLLALLEAMAAPKVSSPICQEGAAATTNFFRYSHGALPHSLETEENSTGSLRSSLRPLRPYCHRSLDSLAAGAAAHAQQKSPFHPITIAEEAKIPDHSLSIPDLRPDANSPQVRRSISSQGDLYRPSRDDTNRLRLSVQYDCTLDSDLNSLRKIDSTPCFLQDSSNQVFHRASKSEESFHLYEEFQYGAFEAAKVELKDSEGKSHHCNRTSSGTRHPREDEAMGEAVYETVKFGNGVKSVAEDNIYEEHEYECIPDPTGPAVPLRSKKNKIHFPSLKRSQSKSQKAAREKSTGSHDAAKAGDKTKPKKLKEGTAVTDCKRGKSFFQKLFHFSSKKESKKASKENETEKEYEMSYRSADYTSFYEMQSNHVIYQTTQKTDQSTSTSLTSVQSPEGVLEKSIQVDVHSLEAECQSEARPLAGSLLILRKELMDELKVKMEEKRRSMASTIDEPEDTFSLASNSARVSIEEHEISDVAGKINDTGTTQEAPLYSKACKSTLDKETLPIQLLFPKEMFYPGESPVEDLPCLSPFHDDCDYSIYFPMAFQTPDRTPPLPPKTRARPLSPTHDVPLNNAPVSEYNVSFPHVLQDSVRVSQVTETGFPVDLHVSAPREQTTELALCNKEGSSSESSGSECAETDEESSGAEEDASAKSNETSDVEASHLVHHNGGGCTEQAEYELAQESDAIALWIQPVAQETLSDQDSDPPARKSPSPRSSRDPPEPTPSLANATERPLHLRRNSDPDYDYPRPHPTPAANNGSHSPDLNDELDAMGAQESHSDSDQTESSSDYDWISTENSDSNSTPTGSQRTTIRPRDHTTRQTCNAEAEFQSLVEQCRDNESLLVQVKNQADESIIDVNNGSGNNSIPIIADEAEVILRKRTEPRPSSEMRLSYVATETVIVQAEEATPLEPSDMLELPMFQVAMDDETLEGYDSPGDLHQSKLSRDKLLSIKRPSQIPSSEDLRASGIGHLQDFLTHLDTETALERQGAVSKLGHSVAVAKLREFFEKEGGHSGD